MWPFSTIKHLRWELEQANTANEIMRTALTRRDERLDETQHALVVVKGSLLAEENKVRDLEGKLVIAKHEVQAKFAQIAGLHSLNKSLAAERDEAVLRARRLDSDFRMQAGAHQAANNVRDAIIEAQKHVLRGALVRDPKTGRMTKWVDSSREQEAAAMLNAGFGKANYVGDESVVK